MKSHSETRRPAAVKDGVWTVLRAVRSTLVIGAVTVLLVAAREGGFHWNRIKGLAQQNRTLFVMVFFAVLIWDYWFQRAKRQRAIEQRSLD